MRFCFFLMFVLATFYACRKDPADSVNPKAYNADWTALTHERRVPDYESVFPQNSVNTIEITMRADQWGQIQTNTSDIFNCNFGQQRLQIPENLSGEIPENVDVTLKFNGRSWKNVGFRLRGNKMLGAIWNNGIYKLPFLLNFDRFEDLFPGIKNQRFFGFKEMSFNPGYKDPSLIREKLARDFFRFNGIPAAQTAFYKVFIDFGSGLKYCGVYVASEVPEDNLLKDQLNENSGNLYKPASALKIFNKNDFEKKNNEANGDYSDVEGFVNILNSPQRISNPVQWAANLESKVDINQFLKWLAISNTLVDPGAYGTSAENYYLYHHSNGKFIWIPWDHNEALSADPGIIGAPGGNGNFGLSLSMNEVTANWPMIRHIIDNPAWLTIYKNELRNFSNSNFTPAVSNNLIDKYYALISDAVVGAQGEQPGYTLLPNSAAFLNEKNTIKNRINNRRNLINSFVQ
jgi:spore coat protein H